MASRVREKMEQLYLGIDVGSISANTVVMNQAGAIVEEHYTRVRGQPLRTIAGVLDRIFSRIPVERFFRIALTGTGGKVVAELLGGEFYNEIIAQAKAIERLYPTVRTIMDIGGEDSKLILLAQEDGRVRIDDFSMNTLCAAGTGSFLDQQASRLGLTIEAFGELALHSENPPRIAGRCSVFAKSDMIHLQQIATPDYDIVAGLCYALARNFKSNIGTGREIRKPVAFQGGVAANAGMRRAFRDILALDEGELIIPEHHASMGAIGSVLLALEQGGLSEKKIVEIERLQEYITQQRDTAQEGWEPLSLALHHLEDKGRVVEIEATARKTPAYLVLDVGSISTNLVVIDEAERVIAKRYLMTAGRPIEAIRQGLQEIGEEVGALVEIKGVGSTGSGRYLTGDFVGADIVRNEITAQATAAANIDPAVDTIFEIGGQDSKYVSLDQGVIVDFEMNKVCAAGTGSFLEEQAERLGISIKEEFAHKALAAPAPVRMGERCTVFIESDLVHHQQRGAKTGDLVAGLCYSIVQNYLNRVVGDRRVGDKIFFQGGTAFNKGVVAAFERVLGKKITVPENHDVTGAIGVALLAKKERFWEQSNFKGFDLSQRRYDITTFECKGCPNMCLIRKVSVEGEKPLFYGSRCEKYDVVRKGKGGALPDLFAERETFLFGPCPGEEALGDDAPAIGIPRILTFHELLPFWKAFFTALGYQVVLSDPTNKELIRQGVESVVAETCFPVKVAHGHVLNLLEKGVKRIFLPSVISMERFSETFENAQTCPYVQSFPYAVHSSIDFKRYKAQVVQPVIPFGRGLQEVERALVQLGKELKRRRGEVRRAWTRAQEHQERFYRAIALRGREVLEGLREGQKGMVIVGRPYNSCDPAVNLDIPKKLRDLGVLPIPMDYLPLESMREREGIRDMYWKYGQKILAAAHLIKDDPRLFGVYISNFGCGADSFITHFFRDTLKGKPYLQLEIDEHSADAGAITRCEAFLDSLKHAHAPQQEGRRRGRLGGDVSRTIYIPHMGDHAYAFVAAFEACGLSARVFPESTQETLHWGRKYTSGRECYPFILTVGDMIRILKGTDCDPKEVAFFMPSGNGPCRFGQYHRFHRLILDELGYADVPIYAPNQDGTLYRDMGMMGSTFTKLGWWAIVAVDLLIKKLHETRPYERDQGETDQVYQDGLQLVCEAIRTGGEDLEGLQKALREVRERFTRIPVIHPGSKPKIGIVGEIFVRSNRFSNENIVRKIEALGGEAWLAPLVEWIHYINAMSRRHTWKKKDYSNLIKTIVTEYYQKKYERSLDRIFQGSIRTLQEPTTDEVLALAKPYLDPSFEGEAILSIGKTMDFALKGASGVVNVMPFTCMPGTVVSAILKRYREENGNLPVLNMAYDGQEQSNIMTRLEAFMYQASQYQDQHNAEQ
jgi:predicted CoA-substrate-specific enzyme activase